MINKTKETIWFYLFAHHEREDKNKMIQFKIFNRQIFLCGRCSFKYFAVFNTFFLFFFTGTTSKILYNPFFFIIILFVFPILGCIAWVHQFLSKKDNSKLVRYTTGYMIGISEFFGIATIIWFDLFLLIIFLFLFTFYIGVVGIIVYYNGGMDKFQHVTPKKNRLKKCLKCQRYTDKDDKFKYCMYCGHYQI